MLSELVLAIGVGAMSHRFGNHVGNRQGRSLTRSAFHAALAFVVLVSVRRLLSSMSVRAPPFVAEPAARAVLPIIQSEYRLDAKAMEVMKSMLRQDRTLRSTDR
jgi:hypothetical protein